MVVCSYLFAEPIIDFKKTEAYIDSLPYDNPIKEKMLSSMLYSEKIILNIDRHDYQIFLENVRINNCFYDAIKPFEFFQFTSAIMDDVIDSGYEEEYRYVLERDNDWLRKAKPSLLENDVNFFACNCTTKISDINVSLTPVKYQTVEKSYTDPIINYYANEYQKAYLAFLNAKTEDTIFESYIASRLAQSCLGEQFRLTGISDWIDAEGNLRISIEQTITEDPSYQSLAHNNKDKIKWNQYTYDTFIINSILNEITDFMGYAGKSMCKNGNTVSKLYAIFLPKYIHAYQKKLESSRTSLTGKKRRIFERHRKWLVTISYDHKIDSNCSSTYINLDQEVAHDP